MSDQRSDVQPSMPWFRSFTADWGSKVNGLSLVECGLLQVLHVKMIERGEPFPEAFIERLGQSFRAKRNTVKAALETLLAYGLVERIDGGLWSEVAEREIAHREQKTSVGKTNAKKRWRKTQQNQSTDDANAMQRQCYRDEDIEGNRPSGGSQSEVREEIESSGLPSANAGQPTDEDEFYHDLAEPDLDHPPAWLAEAPSPVDDYGEFDGTQPLIVAGRNRAADEKIAAKSGDLQLLERCERQAKRLGDFYSQLVADMRAGLQSGRDLTNGERTMLRDEILPAVRGFERQPGPSEIEWEKSNGGQHAVNGETNAPAR